MAEELLDRILREIGQRREASRAAYEESQRLEAELAALGDAPPSRSTGQSRAVEPRRPARAPRGENLRRIREAVAERPGATAGEIASATGIARPTVASTLGKLARAGELERTELPSGRVGYRPPSGPAEASAPPQPDPEPIGGAPADASAAGVADEPASDETPSAPPRAKRAQSARRGASGAAKRPKAPVDDAEDPGAAPDDAKTDASGDDPDT